MIARHWISEEKRPEDTKTTLVEEEVQVLPEVDLHPEEALQEVYLHPEQDHQEVGLHPEGREGCHPEDPPEARRGEDQEEDEVLQREAGVVNIISIYSTIINYDSGFFSFFPNDPHFKRDQNQYKRGRTPK
jgi:hypothetical protein